MNQGDTFDALYELADRIVAQHLGTCDHIDIWGETGVDGIACKSPADAQCEECGENGCRDHIREVRGEFLCREYAGKL